MKAAKTTYLLYLDDSGTRHPDHVPTNAHERDWFAYGGVLVEESQKSVVDDAVAGLKRKWPECNGAPLHSYEIRHSTGRFLWLGKIGMARRDEFMADIGALLTTVPILSIACVVDRPGYNARYRSVYGRQRWSLCRTAFYLVTERAAKFARDNDARLRVFVEHCSNAANARAKAYYDELRKSGNPFNAVRSADYRPLSQREYKDTLFEFRIKTKDSESMQVADLVLHPLCVGGYDRDHRPYRFLLDKRKVVDCNYAGQESERGVKYSCFERVPAAP